MTGSEPQVVLSVLAVVLLLIAVGGNVFTWSTSRAKKVRLVEDQVLEELRLQRARAEQVETRLAEWQVTIQGILAEVEEFFERSVKERKRISQSNAMAARREEQEQAPVDIADLPRAEQLQVVDEAFRRRGH